MRTYILLCASTLTVLAGATIAPALPEMNMHFNHLENSELLVKLVLSITGLFIAISSPVAGSICDRADKLKILSIAVCVFGVSGTTGFFADNAIFLLLISRAILGIAVAFIMVSVTSLAAEYFTDGERHKYIGLQAAFGSFGGVIFLGLGSVFAEVSWQFPFLIYALAFVLLPFLYCHLRPLASVTSPPLPVGNCANGTSKESPIQPKALAGERTRMSFLLVMFFCGLAFLEIFCLYLIPVHFPFYADVLGFEHTWLIGGAMAYMLLVLSVCSMLYHRVKQHFSFYVLQCVGLSMVALGLVTLAEAKNIMGSFSALTILGLGFGLLRPNLMLWFLHSAPVRHRAQLLGWLTCCYFLPQFLVPVMTQPIVKSSGYAELFYMVGVFLIACVAIFAVSHLTKSLSLLKRYLLR